MRKKVTWLLFLKDHSVSLLSEARKGEMKEKEVKRERKKRKCHIIPLRIYEEIER